MNYRIYRLTSDRYTEDTYFATKAEAHAAFIAEVSYTQTEHAAAAYTYDTECNITLEQYVIPFRGKSTICALLSHMAFASDIETLEDVTIVGVAVTTFVRNGKRLRERRTF